MNGQQKKELLNNINMAINYVHNRQREKAVNIFNDLQAIPDDPELSIRFGILCKLLGERGIARDKLYKLLEKTPDDPVILDLLVSVLMDDGQYQEADHYLRKLIDITPQQWQPLLNLGITNICLKNYDEAIIFLEKAQSLKPGQTRIYDNLADCLMRTDRHAEAIENAEKAIKLDPKNYNAHIVMGLALSHMGKISEGIKYTEKAIRLDRFNPLAYVNLVAMKKFSDNDKKLITGIEKILEGNMPAIDRSLFCFALGRMYDDGKEWDKAFSYIKQANLLASTKYQENPAPKKHLRSLKKTYYKEIFEKYRSIGNQSEIPVFIVGMPRSGSSLIEQIISSHPEAAGAGEITEMESLLKSAGSTDNPGKYQARVNEIINKESIHKLSAAYLDKLRNKRESARRITDKNINNYFYLGLITLLLPNAKIIHISRSPLDTCISCYFQYFSHHNLGWSFDPGWITNTYHTYRQTMAFWQGVLPENKILDIQYEHLINDPEQHIRKIIDYCNLDWHPACLEFYNSSNIVKTASMMQVRQPVYRKSIERWKNYGAHVGEFATGLLEYLDDADKVYLSALGIKLGSKKWWYISG